MFELVFIHSKAGFSIRIKVGGRNVKVGGEGVTGPSREVQGNIPRETFKI